MTRWGSAITAMLLLAGCADGNDWRDRNTDRPLTLASAAQGEIVLLDVDFQQGDWPLDEVVTGSGEPKFGPAHARFELIRALEECGVQLIWLDTTQNHVVRVGFPSNSSAFYEIRDAQLEKKLRSFYDNVRIIECVRRETDVAFRPGIARGNEPEVEPDSGAFRDLEQ